MRSMRFAFVLIAAASAWGGCSPSRSPPEGSEPDRTYRLTTTPSEFDSIMELAIDVYYRGEYDSVRAIMDPALLQARAECDSVAEARILTLLGQTAYREADYAQARQLGEAALQLKLQIGHESELARSYNALGLVAFDEGRRADALDLFERTLQTVPADGYDSVLAAVSINRGLIYTDLGDFDRARLSFVTGRDLSIKFRRPRWVASAVNNLAMVEVWTGNPAAAISMLQQAVRSFDSLEYAPGGINALGQLGTAYSAIGEIGNAVAVLDSAISLSRKRGMRGEEASNIEALAEVHRIAGNYLRALALYAEAEAINEEMGVVEQTGADQRSRAEIYSLLGDTRLALEFARRALETHESVDARWEGCADHVLLAELEHAAGNLRASAEHLRLARQLAAEFDARTARLDIALLEARLAERDSAPSRVLRALQAAENDLAAGDYDSEWEAEVLKARAFTSLGQRDSATAAARRSVAALERVRTGAGSGMLRTAYGHRRSEAYVALVAALLAQGDVEGAFEAADRSRGRALLEHLAALPSDTAGATSPHRNLREAERMLRLVGMLTTGLAEWEIELPAERDSAAIRDVSGRLAQARSEYEALLARSSEAESSALALLGGTVPTGNIMRSLAPTEALLQYFVTSDRVIGFVATHERISTFDALVSEEVLCRRVRVARDMVGNPEANVDAARDVLNALHELLVSPALEAGYLTGIAHVTVVPHGVLNYLPFAALMNPSSGRFMAEGYEVQVLPAAAALSVLRERQTSVTAMRAGRLSGVAFAPLPKSLPATRAEARAFSRAISRGRSVTGENATESRLRGALVESEVVHLATHGVMNVRNPLFSRLELSPGSGEPHDDGRLEVHELLALPVRSELVFLSGCETGVGPAWSTEFARGEDYATLGLAFLYAGASNVVATLWPIEDEGAGTFAETFYRQLAESGPAEALARTQRLMISDERYGAPYYWAGYQLSGSGMMANEAQLSGR